MHRVTGRSPKGNVVAAVVEGHELALAKADEFIEDGFTDIKVGRLDDTELSLEEFRSLAGASSAPTETSQPQ
jgi:hypothetical protein